MTQHLPPEWSEEKLTRVAAYYDAQSPQDELAEFEAAWESGENALVEVPRALLPAVRELIRAYEAKLPSA